MYKAIKIFLICLFLFGTSLSSLAQQQGPQTPEEKAKQLYEQTQKVVDDYAEQFQLADWQVFYLDSILMHNNTAMMAEMEKLQMQKVANQDIYINVRDTWMERTDRALEKLFTKEQWEKYLKSGGAKSQKMRDKRKQK